MKKKTDQRGEGWWPKIAERKDRGNWRVDCGYKFGADRLRETFPTLAEAKQYAEAKHNEWLAVLGAKKTEKKQEAKSGGSVRLSGLNERQRGDMSAALSKAGNDSAMVARAVEFYLKHHGAAGTSLKLCRVYQEYMRSKRKLGRRSATVKDAHVKLRHFLKAYRAAKVSDVTTSDIERWLDGRNLSAITRNSYRAAIVALFNHAVRRRYIEVNPAEIIELSMMDQTLPGIHTVEEVRLMLSAAANFIPMVTPMGRKGKGGGSKWEKTPETDPEKIEAARARVVPYLAIGYFAGLRPQNELANLAWQDIDFSGRTIRVTPATAKKRRQRYVDMSDNLIQWLAPYAARANKTDKIGFSRFTFRAVRELAGVDWPKDVMRHCFGTYHSAMYKNNALTSEQMGHTRTSELFKSYKNLVKRTDAESFWSIAPTPQKPAKTKKAG
jgi:integrase